MGQDELKHVHFSLAEPGPSIELTGLRDIIRRGGRREFLSTQRLDFELLYLLERGRTVHQVDFVANALGPGDALWVRAGQVHRWGDISELDGRVAIFPSHVIGAEVGQALADLAAGASATPSTAWPASQLRAAGVAEAWRALHAPDQLPPEDVRARALLREAALSAVLLRLASIGSEGTRPESDRHGPLLGDFAAEIESRFTITRSVEDYARRLGWSAKSLTRAAAAQGTTPKSMIDDRVVLEAKRLLVHTADTVAQVAAHLGFDDPSNFSAFFRKRTALTPAEFRRSWQQGRDR